MWVTAGGILAAAAMTTAVIVPANAADAPKQPIWFRDGPVERQAKKRCQVPGIRFQCQPKAHPSGGP